MKCYLGIDIGTFESKGVLVDGEGKILASAARPHKMLVPQAGWAEHRPDEDWWGDFTYLSNRLLADSKINPKDIKSVGVSAIGICVLPVDKQGAPLMNGILYGVDTRAAKEIAILNKKLGEKKILKDTGNALTSQSAGPKILWLKNNRPEIYKKAAKFITSQTYIVHKLTGHYVIDHFSASNAAPLYVEAEGGWSKRYTKHICNPDRLANVRWSTDVIGEVQGAAATQTGLAAGTPVITGTIDAAAEAVSVGVLDPGQMMLMYGSTIFTIMVTRNRVNDSRLWYSPWLFKGQHASMAGLATSGTLTHWFRENFAHELRDNPEAPAILAREAAASPPGAKGLVMLPYFSGERTPMHDPNAKGVLFGLNLTHTRADAYRALLEGIGFGTRQIMDTYKDVGLKPKSIEAVGGGTKNAVWGQSTSDIGKFRQNVRSKTIGASYGDAFLAALGVGDVKRSDIADWNAPERVIEVSKAAAKTYEKSYGVFKELYKRNRDLMALF